MSKAKSNEIQIIRMYDAPVETVWDAWTDPQQVAKWWGPRGFTLTTHSKELRVDGIWDYTMHGPDGTDYPNKTKYLEVEKHKKLVYDHGGNDEREPLFRVTVHFTDVKGKTKMDMTMALPTPEEAARTKTFIKKAGGDSTWDRLAEYLERETSGREQFVINRSFEAPLSVVSEMWTNPDHFSKWLAPTGFTMDFIRKDISPGRSSFYVMTGEDKTKMYGRIEYKKIEKPGMIEYTQQFCDEHEKVSRHPMSPTWPETMLTTVTLTEEGPESTRVTIVWEPLGNITREELQTFINAKAGMTQGWTGSLDKLENYLVNVR